MFTLFAVYYIESYAHYLSICLLFYEFTSCGKTTHQYSIELLHL